MDIRRSAEPDRRPCDRRTGSAHARIRTTGVVSDILSWHLFRTGLEQCYGTKDNGRQRCRQCRLDNESHETISMATAGGSIPPETVADQGNAQQNRDSCHATESSESDCAREASAHRNPNFRCPLQRPYKAWGPLRVLR